MSIINALRKQLFRAYGFTLRKTSNVHNTTRQTYADRFGYFKELGCKVVDITFEETAGLHCHGIIEIPTSLSIKRLRCRGWNFKYEIIYDKDGWIRYMYKDQELPIDSASLGTLAQTSEGSPRAK